MIKKLYLFQGEDSTLDVDDLLPNEFRHALLERLFGARAKHHHLHFVLYDLARPSYLDRSLQLIASEHEESDIGMHKLRDRYGYAFL